MKSNYSSPTTMQNRTAHLHPSFWGFASTLCTLGLILIMMFLYLPTQHAELMITISLLAAFLTPVISILGIIFGVVGIICDRKRIFAFTGLISNSVILMMIAIYIFSLTSDVFLRMEKIREESKQKTATGATTEERVVPEL